MYDQYVLGLFSSARFRGLRGRIRSALTRRSNRLFTLAGIDAACTVRPQRCAGLRTVAIGDIRGSESRGDDFDRDFYPLKDHSQDRWVSIATARQRGKTLPPVDLIQVGDVYFVRDGHHRISVARMLGQLDVEAGVTVWQVSGPLPWETPTPEARGIGQLQARVRGENTCLRERIQQSVGSFTSGLVARLKPRVLA